MNPNDSYRVHRNDDEKLDKLERELSKLTATAPSAAADAKLSECVESAKDAIGYPCDYKHLRDAISGVPSAKSATLVKWPPSVISHKHEDEVSRDALQPMSNGDGSAIVTVYKNKYGDDIGAVAKLRMYIDGNGVYQSQPEHRRCVISAAPKVLPPTSPHRPVFLTTRGIGDCMLWFNDIIRAQCVDAMQNDGVALFEFPAHIFRHVDPEQRQHLHDLYCAIVAMKLKDTGFWRDSQAVAVCKIIPGYSKPIDIINSVMNDLQKHEVVQQKCRVIQSYCGHDELRAVMNNADVKKDITLALPYEGHSPVMDLCNTGIKSDYDRLVARALMWPVDRVLDIPVRSADVAGRLDPELCTVQVFQQDVTDIQASAECLAIVRKARQCGEKAQPSQHATVVVPRSTSEATKKIREEWYKDICKSNDNTDKQHDAPNSKKLVIFILTWPLKKIFHLIVTFLNFMFNTENPAKHGTESDVNTVEHRAISPDLSANTAVGQDKVGNVASSSMENTTVVPAPGKDSGKAKSLP